MSKNQFRILIVMSLLLVILAGAYDFWWPDPIAEKVMDYAYEIEPEITGVKLFVLVGAGLAASVLAVVSFVGLLIFKAWARPLYLAGFIIFLPIYSLLGVSIYSGVSQIFYDLSVMASGAILALLYFSPIAELYAKGNLTSRRSPTR